MVARGNPDGVSAVVDWRGVRSDPAVVELLRALPPRATFVRIKLEDGRTELVPTGWQHLRFGDGPPIFEAARRDSQAWAQGQGWSYVPSIARASKYVMDATLRHVPNFLDYSEAEQIDFIARTQEKIDKIRDGVEDLIRHLEYAAPDKHKAVPPVEDPLCDIKAAVFADVMDLVRAGELLGVDLPKGDEGKYENQTVRKRADKGRQLLHDHFGSTEWEIKVGRMRGYRRWWERLESIEDPKQQVYELLAKARGTSAERERVGAEKDGFGALLDEWVAVTKRRQHLQEGVSRSEERPDHDGASRDIWRLLAEQGGIEERDERFSVAFALFDKPPASMP